MTCEEMMRTYFRRLGMSMPEKFVPDGETLCRLHRQHTLMIPYENSDYLTGDIRSTDFETQFREVIVGKRGGMCIDLNPLFGEFLTAAGYSVRCFSTVICQRSPQDLNYHAILNVEDCEGKLWWCDIANPFTRFYEPLPLITGEELSASGSVFRFERDENGKYLLREKKAGQWIDLLRIRDADITAEDRNASKFGAVRDYPSNPICYKEIFSVLTPEGRRTLTGKLYRESEGNVFYQYECSDEMMPWAYSQFGVKRREGKEKIDG